MTVGLAASADSLRHWLNDAALPLWWERGADYEGGGFHELLGLDGEPVAADRRARVQARQVYSYAVGGRVLGWTGPWRAAVEHGLDYFISRYRLENGLFRTKAHVDGSPADDTVWLYDQAFALLALAEGVKASPSAYDYAAIAHRIIGALADRRIRAGGFQEADAAKPFQSNPHMHLLEACLAWREIDDAPLWDQLTDEIAGLALSRFIDDQGALHEFFAEDWSFAPGVDGRIVEPGHQFEWAWLLERWARLRSRGDAHRAAARLFEIGLQHGVDPARGVAFDQLLDDFSTHSAMARLWPQTERIKAAIIHAAVSPDPEACRQEAVNGIKGLKRYLDTPIRGLWRDKMNPDGSFVQEPAPASSFYHIVCAIAELVQTV